MGKVIEFDGTFPVYQSVCPLVDTPVFRTSLYTESAEASNEMVDHFTNVHAPATVEQVLR